MINQKIEVKQANTDYDKFTFRVDRPTYCDLVFGTTNTKGTTIRYKGVKVGGIGKVYVDKEIKCRNHLYMAVKSEYPNQSTFDIITLKEWFDDEKQARKWLNDNRQRLIPMLYIANAKGSRLDPVTMKPQSKNKLGIIYKGRNYFCDEYKKLNEPEVSKFETP